MHQAHTDLNKKNGGVNSFLVTVWLSMMVGSLRSREKKPSAATSRLTYNGSIPWKQVNPYWTMFVITERKTRMGVDFCNTLYKRKYSKGLNRWMELSSFIHISYRHDVTPTPCTFSDFYREKRGECSRSLGGWPVKLNC